MAQYKVIQDIEAEDKLLGPLSLRQFIYAVICIILIFISFKLFLVQPLLALPLLFPAGLFGVLAAPFGHDQSSEIWLLAKIRFALKPQRRIWDQTGLQEMVTITVPKKLEAPLTNGLSQDQVKSRLEALAQTIDSRGWVVKGVNVNMFANPSYSADSQSDRLVDVASVATEVPEFDIQANDDMLDEQHNQVAQQMDQLVHAKDDAHREAILEHMQQIRENQNAAGSQAEVPPAFSGPYTPPAQSYSTPEPVIMNPDPVRQLTDEAVTTPIATITPSPSVATSMKEAPNTAILGLANNNDLTVATIAREAHRDQPSDEVVVSLR
jgi:hypothetical protein